MLGFLNEALVKTAAKNNGGKVIVYVKALKEELFKPHLVHLPYVFVDAIIVDPEHVQTAPHLAYNPCFSNEKRCDAAEMRAIMESEISLGRVIAAEVIARRAAWISAFLAPWR